MATHKATQPEQLATLAEAWDALPEDARQRVLDVVAEVLAACPTPPRKG